MLVSEQEINEIRNFVSELNSIEESAVVVEGKRDAIALRKLGFDGKILEFHRFGGIVNFADTVASHKRLIILFDRDRKGRILTGRTVQLLQRRTKIDLSYKQKLVAITKGRIRFIEELVRYESYIF